MDDETLFFAKKYSKDKIEEAIDGVNSDLAAIANESSKTNMLCNVNPNEAITYMVLDHLDIPTYTGINNEIVHPSMLFFPSGWNGYMYWLGYTCYDNGDSQYENPCIAVSNDNVTWIAPPGLTNPVEPKPSTGFLADINLFMSPDQKTMYMIFKYSHGVSDTCLRTSTDGIHWSSKVTLFSEAFESLSPSVLWDGTQYIMWFVKSADTPNNIYIRTASVPEGPWSDPVLCTHNLPVATEPWHLEVRKYGNQYHMLIQTIVPYKLYFGVSEDLITWDLGQVPIMEKTIIPYVYFYKSTMIPMLTDKGLKYGLWYGTTEPYYICYNEISFDRTQRTDDYGNKVLRAAATIAPWIFADTFNRADDATTLGTSTSGLTWTKAIGNSMGIASNKACLATTGNTRWVTDLGVADFYVEVQMSILGTSGYLVFRYQDEYNWWRIGNNAAVLELQKLVDPDTVATVETGLKIFAGDVLGVECKDESISVYINGNKMFTTTDAALKTATKIGLNCGNTTSRFDNLIARSV
jgi:hypothetical protein